jgi:hypothetical protein
LTAVTKKETRLKNNIMKKPLLTTAMIMIIMIAAVATPIITATTVYAQDADTVCLLNPVMCSFAGELERQEEFSQRMEEATDEAAQETADEEAGNPTVDEFLAELEAEGDARRAAEREQMAENGIEIDESTEEPIAAAGAVRPKGFDTEFAIQFLNQTFDPILNLEPTEIDEYEEELDPDEGEVPRQTITYEFNPETTEDDVRIYTAPDQTAQSLATRIATHLHSTDITLYENGRAMIVCEGASFADDTTIYAPHNYTAANGYQYVNGTILSPTGQELLSTAYGMHDISDYQAEAETQQC